MIILVATSQRSGSGVHIRFHSSTSSSSGSESGAPDKVPSKPQNNRGTPQDQTKRPEKRRSSSSKKPTPVIVGGSKDLFEARSKVYTRDWLSTTPDGGTLRKKVEDGGARPQQQGRGGRRGRGGKISLSAGRGGAGGNQLDAGGSGNGVNQETGGSVISGDNTPLRSILCTAMFIPSAESDNLTPQRDYSSLPDLHGAPRAGDKIAFKVCKKVC